MLFCVIFVFLPKINQDKQRKMIKENFIRLFEDSFRNNWDLEAYTDFGDNKTVTYGQVAEEIARIHLIFEQAGIEKDDKVALIGRNSSNWAIAYLATVTYGAVIIPILQDFKPNDVHHIINHSESKMLFVSDHIWDTLDESALNCVRTIFSLNDNRVLHIIQKPRCLPLGEDGSVLEEVDVKDENEEQVFDKLDPAIFDKKNIDKLFEERYTDGFHRDVVRYIDKPNSEMVCISYTSGTTGFSKGVMLTGNNYAGNITFGIITGLLALGYNIVAFLPLAHAYGCAFDFLTATALGAHVHFIGRIPTPKILLKAFAEIRPNVIFTVPLIIEKIYKKQIQPLLGKAALRWVLKVPFLDQTILAQIRKKLVDAFGGNFSQIVVGGAPLNAEVEEFFHKIKFPFTVGYGMTECAPLISYAHKDEFKLKSSGRILDGIMEVKIDNPDPETGIGEIFVRGENVMIGYYKNEAATNEVLDDDGWLHTGDLGTVDDDGTIYIRGRNKTMMLGPSGQNIYPEEIEAKLNNMPYVFESLVVESKGRLIGLVYPDYEVMDKDGITHGELEEIMEENRVQLNQMVAAYEGIGSIKLYPNEFEKTPKKSIKRYLYTAGV